MAKIKSTLIQEGAKKEMGFGSELIYGNQGGHFQSVFL